jgi:sulfonate transport system permease protein
VGFVIGAAIGIVLGTIPFLLPHHEEIPIRILSLLRAVPLFSLVPLWLFWFSGGSPASISYVTFAVAVLVASSLHDSTNAVPRIYLDQSFLLGASRCQTLWHVVLPALLRLTASAAKWISGLLLPFSLGAELLDTDSGGLGKLVYNSYAYANLGQLLLLTGIYALTGALLSSLTTRWINTASLYTYR